MATYSEIHTIAVGGDPQDNALRARIAVAVAVAAQGYLISGTSTAAEKAWASRSAGNIKAAADIVYPLVLAANKAASIAQIRGATDEAIQTAVDAVTSALAEGSAGG